MISFVDLNNTVSLFLIDYCLIAKIMCLFEKEDSLQTLLDLGIAHYYTMPYLWTIAINFVIFFALYKYRKYAIIIHIFGGLGIAITSFILSLPLLFQTDFPSTVSAARSHYIIGTTIMILILIEVLLGITAKVLNFFQTISFYIYWINKTHLVVGYTLALLCKVQIYLVLETDKAKYWGLLAQDIAFIILFFIRKLYFPQLQGTIQPDFTQQKEEIKLIHSIKEL